MRDLPDRWAHSSAWRPRPSPLPSPWTPADWDLLVVAAWLHDIGYSQPVQVTGFHPLDGAADVSSASQSS